MTLLFFFNNILLGVGLAMDAFSVSIANGLEEPKMPGKRMCLIAGCYGFFQWLMPMTGWLCVHTVASYFIYFQRFIPWIALILLLWIGGRMLWEGIRKHASKKVERTEEREETGKQKTQLSEVSTNPASCPSCLQDQTKRREKAAKQEAGTASDDNTKILGFGELFIQGIATSIDALSVGFTIAEYGWGQAMGASLIIALVTFAICMSGLRFGKLFGEKLADKATIVGGLILIGIGIEIFVSGVA